MSIVSRTELEDEVVGRWIAEVIELPLAPVYGATPDAAIARVRALAMSPIADQLEHDRAGSAVQKRRGAGIAEVGVAAGHAVGRRRPSGLGGPL